MFYHYFTFSLLFILPLVLQAQKRKTSDCRRDSSTHLYWDKYGRKLVAGGVTDFVRHPYLLPIDSERNCFCTLLIYAKMFNTLLQDTIDFTYNLTETPPMSQYLNYSKEHMEKVDRNNRRYNLFVGFLEFKQLYEEDIPLAYRKNKKRSLKKDVNNIIKYGTYNQPRVLRDILLGKYTYLNLKKFKEEIIQFQDNNW